MEGWLGIKLGDRETRRHQTPVSSFRAKREIFVIRGLTVNGWKFQTGNLLSTYLRASPHIYCSEAATTTLNPEPWTPKPLPFLKTLHEKTLDTAASNWYNNTRLSQEPVKRSPKERRKTSWQTKANVILSHKSHDRAANTDRSKAQMKTRPWKRFQKNIWQNEMNVVR